MKEIKSFVWMLIIIIISDIVAIMINPEARGIILMLAVICVFLDLLIFKEDLK